MQTWRNCSVNEFHQRSALAMHQATKIVVKYAEWTCVDMYKLYSHSFNVIHLRCMLPDAIIKQGKSKLYIFTYIYGSSYCTSFKTGL